MKKNNRLRYSFLNVSSNTVYYLLQAIFAFVVRTIFIRKLGAELLGLDSLLLNILSMLSLADLGVSTAISYGLYKPLADNKIKKINAYLMFYKKIYRIIGSFIITVGLIVFFFIPNIVGDCKYEYVYLVYFLYLFNISSLYFISYKDVLIFADQKNYKIFKYNCFFNTSMYLLQFLVLLFLPNYLIYILIMIVMKLINRIIVNIYITNYYKDVDFHSREKLSSEDIKVVKNTVSGMLCYKIGDYAINCTDNIIISSVINVVTVGIYTNYLSIMGILKTIIRNVFDGITSSFGNLSTEGNVKAEHNVFNIMVFICFLISGYVTLCFLNLFNPFIQIWAGKYYVLPIISVILMCINFYLMCNQMPLDTVKSAKGFFDKDKYIPIVQALINIFLSIVLGILYGLNGIIIGTSISYLVTIFWTKPLIMYKYIFKISSLKYFVDQVKYILTIILCYVLTYNLLSYFHFGVTLLNIIFMGIIITIIYIIVITILYYKRYEYKYLIRFLRDFMVKTIKRK